MIHQMIFAAPRPGLSVPDFQDYWLHQHAVRYASQIPQIRRYKVDTVVPPPTGVGEPPWSGIAEIWLRNEEEQLASLQTPEFLDGARSDEPRWAAFWQTVALDTDASVPLAALTPPEAPDQDAVKLVRLVKRAGGVGLDAFRRAMVEEYALRLGDVPGLRGLMVNLCRDGLYGVGEAVLDGAVQLWFDDFDALSRAATTPEWAKAQFHLQTFVEARYVHELVVQEHWVIGPEAR